SVFYELRDVADPRAVDSLLRILDDDTEPWGDRYSAALVFSELYEPRALSPLIAIVDDTSQHHYLREKAVKALRRMGDIAAVPVLIKALGDDSYAVSREAFWALNNLSYYAMDELIDALEYTDHGQREKAADILGNIRHPRAIKPLIDVMGDERLYVRRQIAFSLYQITLQDLGNEQEPWLRWYEERFGNEGY
ncbi:hypothetical protein GF359_08060, partial [candidate division WOR-3 bacterium]|nr:hypothetical protein [candidate division WOR-3 bacterium]MBD3365154.1 hypothetical protein [candidate division WOR-3 bacterium]